MGRTSSSYFTGRDLDDREVAVADNRDKLHNEHFASRCGDGFHGRPYARTMQGRPLGWAADAHVRHHRIHGVGVLPPAPIPHPRSTPVVTIGFGRFVPYTAAASVSSGQWQFVQVISGLRVAMPSYAVRAMVHKGGSPGRAAAAIAGDPAMYGYELHNDTFVPATLSPGDKHMLARSV